MNNYLQPGDILTLTAPAGGVTSGVGYLIGNIFGVAGNTVAAAAEFPLQVTGVFTLPKVSTEVWVEGDKVYWDVANARCTIVEDGSVLVGVAVAAAANPSTTGEVSLNGVTHGGNVYSVRKRFTIAEVNAGDTILPALPGVAYRMLDCAAIAIGGAVGAVTTVDVLGTSTTSRKLVAYAQASLTQSTVLRAGESGAAVLADGASFTANDDNTAVTIGITGSDATTATHVDVILTYAID